MASPIFTLPWPSNMETREFKDGLPLLICPESSTVLDAVLRFCCPTAAPELTQLTELMPAYDALDKYCIESLLKPVEAALVLAVDQNPMLTYTFGCRRHLQPVITAAAKATLTTPLQDLPFIDELDTITGSQLFRLQDYHRRCSESAVAGAQYWDWFAVSDDPLGSAEVGCKCREIYHTYDNPLLGSVFDPSKNYWWFYAQIWWWDYLEAMENTLALRPRGRSSTKPRWILS
ncbi:uncharacterized protein STEHIDRAFT_109116 [Stereum hirsutum FP-91666 SS1]|uniref:uncharacterized protein n=1 Tax=Stereum hirsutum (strain FP-91666) TaxID=721885 RepID=UPI000440C63D|nr:uncharacterized protein STEHIDRAFT_109116 [Stereum hirsutum FP-91666 SS1]EIM88775.1 hypothetical protein STEHIDRAFT_109116 [Stereum hirsutum FP-91666 SS1]